MAGWCRYTHEEERSAYWVERRGFNQNSHDYSAYLINGIFPPGGQQWTLRTFTRRFASRITTWTWRVHGSMAAAAECRLPIYPRRPFIGRYCSCLPIADECTLVTATGRRPLQSSVSGTCIVKRSRNQFSDRCFATAGPTLWNSLPEQIRQPDTTFLRTI